MGTTTVRIYCACISSNSGTSRKPVCRRPRIVFCPGVRRSEIGWVPCVRARHPGGSCRRLSACCRRLLPFLEVIVSAQTVFADVAVVSLRWRYRSAMRNITHAFYTMRSKTSWCIYSPPRFALGGRSDFVLVSDASTIDENYTRFWAFPSARCCRSALSCFDGP